MFPHLWSLFVFIRHCFVAGLLLPLLVGGPAAFAQAAPAPGSALPPVPRHPPVERVVDPAVPVPAVLYRSVFIDTPTGVEAEEVDWRKANADVGQFKRGHVDILQWENRKEAKP